MSRISKADRELQLRHEEAGQHLYANRVRVYPKAVHGPVRQVKWAILAVCLGIYYLLPWLRWDRGEGRPNQAILLDVAHRRFYFFGVELWPQDIYFLTGALIMGAITLFLVTSLFGRLWCGYTCPQTVWTDLFMAAERWIEGDRAVRMRRDAAPVTFDKIWRKALKHAVWLGVAFWTGGAWIMYYIDAPTVTREFWTGTASLEVYGFTLLFTATTYLLAGWAREQVCTYMCPWPRFQSAMLDEQSYTVTYQAWRGEPRGRGVKREAAATGAGVKYGDCIDCGNCVTVCPTGIDIRDGIQLECINCGLCMDACNAVMQKTGRPKWLITWDTLADQGAKAEGRHERGHLIRPRTIIYLAVLVIGFVAMGTAFALRSTISLSVQHDRAPLFVRLPDGSLRNGYAVHIVNKNPRPVDFELSLGGLPGAAMTVAESGAAYSERLRLPIGADTVGQFRILVVDRAGRLAEPSEPIGFTLSDPVTGETTHYEAAFLGPGAAR